MIRVENLVKEMGKQRVLDNITLSFSKGQIYGLKGKNGAGKTVLLKTLCGLFVPTSGDIYIDDYKLGSEYSFPKSVGILIENPGLINQYSGFENLRLVASINNRVDNSRIKELMIAFDLDPYDKKKVKFFSLGMKQKLGIIMALMEDPELIILDEPLNALDEAASQKVLNMLKKEKAAGKIIIIAAHDKEELEFLSDEIIQIEEGKIVAVTKVGEKAG